MYQQISLIGAVAWSGAGFLSLYSLISCLLRALRGLL